MNNNRRFASECFVEENETNKSLPLKKHKTQNNEVEKNEQQEESKTLDLSISISKALSEAKAKRYDQYFTLPSVAKACWKRVKKHVGNVEKYQCVLEPSAGEGAFYNLFPSSLRLGLDIDASETSPFIRVDFLQWNPGSLCTKNPEEVLVVGNPPFGLKAKQAIQFLNYSLKFSNCVCFILPNTFTRPFAQDKIDSSAHLVHSESIQHNPFLFEGKPHNLTCVFQIWTRDTGAPKREKYIPILSHPDFSFLKPKELSLSGDQNLCQENGPFVILRVGDNAGKIISSGTLAPFLNGNYYIIKPVYENVFEIMKSINLEEFPGKMKTRGLNSLTIDQLVRLYLQKRPLETTSNVKKDKKDKKDCLCLSCNQFF